VAAKRYGYAGGKTVRVDVPAVPVGDGWWLMVPIWQRDETPNPLRRFRPAVPYRAADV
jgi:hypothetical protein